MNKNNQTHAVDGQKLVQARKALDLTQDDLIAKLEELGIDISQPQRSRYETNEAEAPISFLKAFAKIVKKPWWMYAMDETDFQQITIYISDIKNENLTQSAGVMLFSTMHIPDASEQTLFKLNQIEKYMQEIRDCIIKNQP